MGIRGNVTAVFAGSATPNSMWIHCQGVVLLLPSINPLSLTLTLVKTVVRNISCKGFAHSCFNIFRQYLRRL